MLKTNYRAWTVDSLDFYDELSDIEKLRYFARYAILAPSGHNTQPWLLDFDDDSLYLSVHPDHHLSIDGSGLQSVEPYISIGTFLWTLENAARGFGYKLKTTLAPDHGHLARITIQGKTSPEPGVLDAITTRVSNRNNFKISPIPKATLTAIVKHQLSYIETKIITKRSDISFVGKQTEAAIGAIMNESVYRKELSKWVRTNHTSKFDGMPGFTHGFNNIQSLFSKVAVRYAPAGGPQTKKSKELINHSAALLVVCCKNDSVEAFINAGRLYSQVCTLGNEFGIASSALGAAVLDPTTRETMKSKFAIDSRPIYILRLGYTDSNALHSPRWPVEKLIN